MSTIERTIPGPTFPPPSQAEPDLIEVGRPDRASRCWLQAPEEAERRRAFAAESAEAVADVIG